MPVVRQFLKTIKNLVVHFRLTPAILLTIAVLFGAANATILIANKQSAHTAAPEKTITSKVSESKKQSEPSTVADVAPAPASSPSSQSATPPSTPSAAPKSQPTTAKPPYIPPTVSYVNLSAYTQCSFDIYKGNVMSTRVFGVPAPIVGDTSNVSISWTWEYEGDVVDMSGLPSGTFSMPVPPGSRLPTLNTSFQSTGFTDGFRYRIKVLSPNVVVSGWANVPSSGTCI